MIKNLITLLVSILIAIIGVIAFIGSSLIGLIVGTVTTFLTVVGVIYIAIKASQEPDDSHHT